MTETLGSQLMNQIHSGELATKKSDAINRVRLDILPVFEEFIEIGARIRPLMQGDKQLGWVRGLSVAEKKLYSQWYPDVNLRLLKMLELATTLTETELRGLDSFHIRSLVRLVTSITKSDSSLYPYLFAFVSTSSSEALWHSQGRDLCSFFNKKIELPDGKVIKILCPSDHSRLWASLCQGRETAKARLDAQYNSAMVASAFAGKGVQKIFSNLNKASKMLATNSEHPWRNIVIVEDEEKDYQDGWGHAHIDDSEEGLLREGQGMMEFDLHEQFMDKFYTQQMDLQQKKILEAEIGMNRLRESGGEIEETVTIITEKQAKAEESRIRQERNAVSEFASSEMTDQIKRSEEKEDRLTFIID